jgi:hypothetical protein
MGDMDIFLFVLQSFAHNMPAEVENLRGVSEQSLPLYAINIHAVKGDCASIGAVQLSEKACIIEGMANSGDLSGVLKENEAFIKDAENLIANINNLTILLVFLPDNCVCEKPCIPLGMRGFHILVLGQKSCAI